MGYAVRGPTPGAYGPEPLPPPRDPGWYLACRRCIPRALTASGRYRAHDEALPAPAPWLPPPPRSLSHPRQILREPLGIVYPDVLFVARPPCRGAFLVG